MCSAPSSAAGECSCLNDLWYDPAVGTESIRAASGTVLYEPDTPATSIYSIELGQVRIYQVSPNDTRLLRILGPGDWFGTASLAKSPTFGKRAVVVGASVIRRVSAERLVQYLSEQPSHAAISLIRQLAEKLLEAQEDAARLAFDDCNSRLIKTLMRFSASAAATSAGGDEIVLRITHQQLAQAVGAARETVSLALTELRQQNLLRTGRNQLIFNPDVLARWFVNHRGGSAADARRHEAMESVA